MPAPELSAFGDGSHSAGDSGLSVDGGGFGAFPGSLWIVENSDGSGAADELTVGAWNDIALSGVEIPGSLTNTAGTRYLRLLREDLAWSNTLAFTLSTTVSDTGTLSDAAAGADTRAAIAATLGARSESAAGADTRVAVASTLALLSDAASGSDVRAGVSAAFGSVSDTATAADSRIGETEGNQEADEEDSAAASDSRLGVAVAYGVLVEAGAGTDTRAAVASAFGAVSEVASASDARAALAASSGAGADSAAASDVCTGVSSADIVIPVDWRRIVRVGWRRMETRS